MIIMKRSLTYIKLFEEFSKNNISVDEIIDTIDSIFIEEYDNNNLKKHLIGKNDKLSHSDILVIDIYDSHTSETFELNSNFLNSLERVFRFLRLNNCSIINTSFVSSNVPYVFSGDDILEYDKHLSSLGKSLDVNSLTIVIRLDSSISENQNLSNLLYDGYDIMESMNIWNEALLSSIGAKKVNIFDTLYLPLDKYNNKLDIDYLSTDIEFINSLSSLGLKKSEVYNSDDYQTFLKDSCKFMFVYDINANELENPEYLLFQTYIDNKWGECELYEINGNVNRFYDKLSSKTIEIIDNDGIKYIYNTSNGNDWILQSDIESDIFKKEFRREEIKDLLNNNHIKVNII